MIVKTPEFVTNLAAAASESLRIMRAEPWRVEKLQRNARHFGAFRRSRQGNIYI